MMHACMLPGHGALEIHFDLGAKKSLALGFVVAIMRRLVDGNGDGSSSSSSSSISSGIVGARNRARHNPRVGGRRSSIRVRSGDSRIKIVVCQAQAVADGHAPQSTPRAGRQPAAPHGQKLGVSWVKRSA